MKSYDVGRTRPYKGHDDRRRHHRYQHRRRKHTRQMHMRVYISGDFGEGGGWVNSAVTSLQHNNIEGDSSNTVVYILYILLYSGHNMTGVSIGRP